MIRTRNILLLTPLLILLLTPLWWPVAADFLRPRGQLDSPGQDESKKAKIFTLENIVFTQMRGGQEELQLLARKVSSDDTQELLQMEDAAARLFDQRRREINITSGEAVYEMKEEALTLRDNVQVSGQDGFQVKTSVLQYLAKLKKIKTAEPVQLTARDIIITGQGLFYDLVTGDFGIGGVTGRVRCELQP